MNAIQSEPSRLTQLRAALSTRLYASGVSFARRWSVPLDAAETRTLRRRRDGAYALHLAYMSRPSLRRALRQVEREDWRMLPLFLARAPLDIWRVRQGDAPPVKPNDNFPYPDYYLHAFHHQLNGNLSRAAARTYEWQIRWLFFGTNRLMRQAVVDLLPRGDDLEVLDVGCGTAAWLPLARLQGRHHAVTGVDLSPDYLAVARDRQTANAQFAQHNAEELPLHWRGRFDQVVSIWLLHELPPAARERVVAEMARVLKPGGTLLLMDAAQPTDAPEISDGQRLGVAFAETFREPYFLSYQDLDLAALLGRHGLAVAQVQICYASRIMVCHHALPEAAA